jgi:hypothetical protein
MSALEIQCPACGELLPAGARFCRSCGHTQTAATRSCPSCGGLSPAAAQFCGDCGQPFSAVTPSNLLDFELLNTRTIEGQLAPADRRSDLLQPADPLATAAPVPGTAADSPEDEDRVGAGLLPLPVGSAPAVPNVPGIGAGPQIGAPNVPGIGAGPQIGAPNVPGIGAGPQVGAPNVPGIGAGPQVGIPHSASPLGHPFSPPGTPGAVPQGTPGVPPANPPAPGSPGGGGGYGGGGGSGGGGGGGSSGPGNGFPGDDPTLPGTQGGTPPNPPPPHPPIGPLRPPRIGPHPRPPLRLPKLIISLVVLIVALTGGVSAYLIVFAQPPVPLKAAAAEFTQACSGTAALPALSTSVQNISGDPLTWQSKITDVDPAGTLWATLTPAGGTLQPGSSATLTLTPAATLCQDISKATAPVKFRVTLTFLQQSLTLTDSVTPAPTLAFSASPATMTQMCADTEALPPITLTLDNSGSNVPVNWQVSITDTDPAGTIWATASATSGSVAAEQTGTLTLTPVPTLCNDLRQTLAPVAYKANFTYRYKEQTQTTTFTDTIAPPMIVDFHGSLMTTAQTCDLLQPLPAIPITLDNSTSNVPITWALTISDTDPAGDVWASVDTDHGTIDPGQQATITLTPVAALCLSLVGRQTTDFTAILSYSGADKTQQMTLMDSVTPPPAVNNLQISPQAVSQGCTSQSASLPAIQVTLDNRQSTVSVAWQVSISDTDPVGAVWAGASPGSGTVPAGQTATLHIMPIGALCSHMFFSAGSLTYRATISQSALGQTNTVTVRDTVAPPPAVNNFRLSGASVAQDCNQTNPLPAFSVTLDNTQSNVAVNWSIGATNWGSASPTAGTVPAGKTATLTITPDAKLCSSLGPGSQATAFQATVSGTAAGQTKKLSITDTVTPIRAVVNFSASPLTFAQDCNSTPQLPGLSIALNNTGSNVAVQWQVSITQTDPKGNIWATAKPTSGAVGAGARAALTIAPGANLCNDLPGNGPAVAFKAVIKYTASSGQTGSITITDNVTPFVIIF